MKQIKLTQGFITQVDDIDYDYLMKFSWCAGKQPTICYAITDIKKSNGKWTTTCMHKLILDRILGCDDRAGLVSDHRDRDGLNNQRYNLRRVTRNLNRHNSKVNGRSKYRGVFWNKQAKKWFAQISIESKQIYLGIFTEEIEAAKSYDKKALELYGREEAVLNFVPAD